MTPIGTTGTFAGRTALVSGAASGIGRAVARALLSQGARVAALDKNRAALDALGSAQGVLPPDEQAGPGLRCYPCDLADAAEVSETVRRCTEELGPVDLLVNVAGILHVGSALEMTVDEWDESLRVNTSGVMLLSREVARGMVRRRDGAIVIVASNAGLVPRLNLCAYSVSKAATLMFARCLGLELAEYGVRCNTVSPGSTATPMLTRLAGDVGYEQTSIEGNPAQFRLGIPLRRIASVDDVCSSILFLLSPNARHITLQNLTIDGGATLGV